MIKWLKIAVALCMHAQLVRTEALYLDSAFEINTPGYLYNLGTKRYLGIDSARKLEIVALEEPRKAMRFRAYLNSTTGDGGFIFLEDKGGDLHKGAGYYPDVSQMHNRPALKACLYTKPYRVILDKFTNSSHFSFYISPPVLMHENAFNIMVKGQCLSIDKTTNKLVLTGCQSFSPKNRNQQLFVWVDSKTYNRGVDPVTYRLNPYAYAKNKPVEEMLKKKCENVKGIRMLSGELKNPANFPLSPVYQIGHTKSDKPAVCNS